MSLKIGKKWAAYSMRNPEFDIRGFTPAGREHQEDAVKAMRTLSKLLNKPIPDDIQLEVESTSQ